LVNQRDRMMLAYKIDDSHIKKTEYKLFILRDQEGHRMASLTRNGAACFLSAFKLDKHIPDLDVIPEGEHAGYWLGDSTPIDGRLVTAFTLERQTWYCYSS